MSDYGYKVQLQAVPCGHTQFVAYHDEDELNYWQAGSRALDERASQTCQRCDTNHDTMDYVPTQVEIGGHRTDGSYRYTELLPTYKHTDHIEERYV